MYNRFSGINLWSSKKIRSSRPEVFCKKAVLKSFTKFTGKHLFEILSFNKVAGLRPETSRPETSNFIKRENLAQLFSCEFCKIFKEHLWWLLLKNTENTVSKHFYFNEESDSSEENSCGNEVFRSAIERN